MKSEPSIFSEGCGTFRWRVVCLASDRARTIPTGQEQDPDNGNGKPSAFFVRVVKHAAGKGIHLQKCVLSEVEFVPVDVQVVLHLDDHESDFVDVEVDAPI